MRVFITGATGIIGFAVAQAIRRAGHEVYGLVRSPEKARILAQNEIFPVRGDLLQPNTYLEAAEQSNILIHAAADYQADTVAVDKLTTEKLLGAGAKGPQPKTFIFTSGVWVYGSTGFAAADETSPLVVPKHVAWRPAHEQMVIQASHIRGIVMRPGCVYGKTGSLTGEWFDQTTKKETLHVVGDGKNHWAMVHVDDLADAYLRAAESHLIGELFNVTDRSRARVQDMVEAVARVTNYAGKILYTPVPEAAQKLGTLAECLALDQHVDSRKAVRLLGWQPRHAGFIDGIDAYYEAWKAHQG
jgi:nucleoside-diphosphate-sugar epimerase